MHFPVRKFSRCGIEVCDCIDFDRSLLALSAVFPSPSEEYADWSLGRRNRALFELHASCFGPHLRGWSSCPSCGEKVEFDIDGGLLTTATPADGSSDGVMIRGDATGFLVAAI